MNEKIAIVVLGNAGLPLSVKFCKLFASVGFDIKSVWIAELYNGTNKTLETTSKELQQATKLKFTNQTNELAGCNIVTVPTHTDKANHPDLTPLLLTSESVGKVLKQGDIVTYEPTVYPGTTEEACVPELEKFSGKKFNIDFFCGYSTEHINQSDKEHRLPSIKKVTNGSTPELAKIVNQLYASIFIAVNYKASSKVADAAKALENTPRDVNILLMNELSLIFNKLCIDALSVLKAAGTKWNFLPFHPGLVGGQCFSGILLPYTKPDSGSYLHSALIVTLLQQLPLKFKASLLT